MPIEPCLPPDWPNFEMTYRHGKTVYRINVENPNGLESGVADLFVNDQRMADGVISLVDDLVSRGYDLRNFTREIMTHFRNLLVVAAVGFDREIVSATEDEGAELARLSKLFSEEDLIRFFNVLT